MLPSIKPFKYEVLLASTFLLMAAMLLFCYPFPQISWDSNYYIERSEDLSPGIRPVGYPVLLKLLHVIPYLQVVGVAQFIIYFISIFFFLKTVQKLYSFNGQVFYFLGVLLLAEPASLYHCINILSDLFFSSITFLYLSTLILFVSTKQKKYLVLHTILIFLSLQTRLLAMFYPVFSCLVLLISFRNMKAVWASLLFVLTLIISAQLDTFRNKMYYGVSVVSPFSGWTAANNALYALKEIPGKPVMTDDPVIKELHRSFTHYLDTTSYFPSPASSDYLWEESCILNVYREKLEDSLAMDYSKAFYTLAPAYAKYGNYVVKTFPAAYFKGFMVPNMASLWSPHDGEMMDYYVFPNPSETVLSRYHMSKEDLHSRHQPYKHFLNDINNSFYKVRLILFLICSVLTLFIAKRLNKQERLVLGTSVLFCILYYGAMLYSSRIMPRYILPVLHLQTTVIFLMMFHFYNNLRSKYSK